MADEQTPAPKQSPKQPDQPQATTTKSTTETTSTQVSPGDSSDGVFSDGSTQAQQDAQIKAAEEANAETKKLADSEREARGA